MNTRFITALTAALFAASCASSQVQEANADAGQVAENGEEAAYSAPPFWPYAASTASTQVKAIEDLLTEWTRPVGTPVAAR